MTSHSRGQRTFSAWKGHSPKTVGAVCDPAVFDGALELPPGVLGPRDGVVVVDLVELGGAPITWPGKLVREETFKDAEPWLVIRVFEDTLLGAAAPNE